MTDETRDALLLWLTERVVECAYLPMRPEVREAGKSLLARARHEIERPEDRG